LSNLSVAVNKLWYFTVFNYDFC